MNNTINTINNTNDNIKEVTTMNNTINTTNNFIEEDTAMINNEYYNNSNNYGYDEEEYDEYEYDEEEYDFCDDDYVSGYDPYDACPRSLNYDKMSDNELENYLMFGDLPDDYDPSVYGLCDDYYSSCPDDSAPRHLDDGMNYCEPVAVAYNPDQIECDDDEWPF